MKNYERSSLALRLAAGLLAALLPLLFAPVRARAQEINVSAVSTNPAQITLQWDSVQTYGGLVNRNLYRRAKGDTAWGSPIWSITSASASTPLSYSDTSVVAGAAYEYCIQTYLTSGNSQDGIGTVSGGINVPVVDNRGKILLLVDASQSVSLSNELVQLQQDLTGDGWSVLRADLPRSTVDAANTNASVWAARSAEITSVKNLIVSNYNADPANVKAVYIVGHLPIPYSGDIVPDGHPEHFGAWPADGYYADVTGNWTNSWTDSSVKDTGATDTRNWNVPGDGKFDLNYIPYGHNLALQVGRVDFFNMTLYPSSAVSETELLRRYLRKEHDYRFKQGAYANIARRALIVDGFLTWNNQDNFGPGQGATIIAWNIRGVIGRGSALADLLTTQEGNFSPWFSWQESNPTNTYLIGCAQSAGGATGNAAGYSTDFGSRPNRSVFNLLFGSYLGDWGFTDDFMRASLAGNATGDSLGLTCFWGGGDNFIWDSMALGETIGYAARVTENNDGYLYTPFGFSMAGVRGVQMGLMGDPTLRLYTVLPPQQLQAASSNGTVTLSWNASPESNLLGYLVYKGASGGGPFTNLTPSFIATPAYTDNSVTPGSSYTYLVKTVKLETTPAGTFQNPSVGVFASITASSSATSIPLAPTGLQVAASNSTTLNLVWTDNDSNAAGYQIQRSSNAGEAFTTLASLPAGSTNYTDNGPLTSGTTFWYQIVATNVAGSSLPSPAAAISGFAGSFGFMPLVTHASRSADPGYADVPVQRIGGSAGSVSVQYATSVGAADTAQPGVDYTATTGTLTFADGETQKIIRVPLLRASPQPPIFFTLTLSNPTGGAGLIKGAFGFNTFCGTRVLVVDTNAPLLSPWQQAIIGPNYSVTSDPGAVGQVGTNLTSAYWGGTWDSTANFQEFGQFIYQPVTGTNLTMTALIAVRNVDTAALMVRSGIDPSTNQMAAIRITDAAAGAQFIARTTTTSYPRSEVALPASSTYTQQSYWVRLTRTGSLFTGAISSDGLNWSTLGSATLTNCPPTALWGFFQDNENGTDLAGAQYSNIAFSGAPATTTLSLGSSPNPSTNGLPVTFTATIATNGVAAAAATGSVVFFDGGNPVYTNNVLSAGIASFTSTTLAVGVHPFTASYSGDATYAASASPVTNQTVIQAGVPLAPTLLSAFPGSSQAILTWSPAATGPGALGYLVYSGTAPGSYGAPIVVGNVTNYTVTGLINGATAYFAIAATNALGNSLLSNELNTTPVGPGGIQNLLAWDFLAAGGSAAYDGNVSSVGSTTTASGMLASTISRGAGSPAAAIQNSSGEGCLNLNSSTSWTAASLATAVSSNSYFQFAVRPVVGNRFSISQVSYVTYQQNSHATATTVLEYSANGSQYVAVATNNPVNSNWTGATNTVSLSGISALQNASNVIFKIYGYGFTGNEDKGLGEVPGNNRDVAVVGAVYYPVATPTFSPAGGTYSGSQSVTISTTTAGSSIRYTTDGSTPTSSYGTLYTGPVTVAADTTLQAIAYQPNFIDSAVASASYVINAPSPVNISLSWSGANLQLTWPQGTLLEATDLAGFWATNLASSPYLVSPTNGRMFYRIRVQ
jgi:Bacterial Ig-like domain (group 3)/Chitobiase/beta-hexosaminidase C-terminal domain/Calx-beta domain